MVFNLERCSDRRFLLVLVIDDFDFSFFKPYVTDLENIYYVEVTDI